MHSIQEVVDYILTELDNYGYNIGDKNENSYFYDKNLNIIQLMVKGVIYNIEYVPDEELSFYNNVIFYIASNLDVKEDRKFEELFEESIQNSKKKLAENIESNLTAEAENILPLNENYPALLVALDSERDAEITYKTLIDIEKSSDNPNQDVIDLLEKILKEELQHIALLSALQANQNSSYVEEDSEEDFNNYIDEIKTEEE